jgi:hypothetical protein
MSGVFVFDHRRYLDCVAPALRRLILSGEPGPWLRSLWESRWSRFPAGMRRPFTFSAPPKTNVHCLFLEEDLSVSENETSCPLPLGQGAQPIEDLQDLYEVTVKRHCLGPGQYVGNAERPQWFLDELLEEGIGIPDRLRTLVDLLDGRAQLWTHGSGGFAEGLHGWLTPEETREAAGLLARLPLPTYPPSFQTMRSFRTGGVYHPPGGSRASLFLSFVRTVADLAWPRGRGIAWGNDVFPADHDPWPLVVEPAWLACNGGVVAKMARSIRKESSFADLPILADALEDAGCSDATLLEHLREPGAHVCGCWALDLLAGNEERAAPLNAG